MNKMITKKEKKKRWELLEPSLQENLVQIKETLLKNRGVKKSQVQEFLEPTLDQVTIDSVDINRKQLEIALARIEKAIKEKEKIIVFGDYDVDGICGTAILWETLHKETKEALPYIPNRLDEGYGLSKKGIDNLPVDTKLIITVDNGIVAVDAVDYANEKGIEVIITDHHTIGKKKPEAFAIVHTTKVCGTTVAYLLSEEIKKKFSTDTSPTDHLGLVALATIADLVPLIGASRAVTKFGLQELPKTKRLGLKELFKEAGLTKSEIGCYEVGHMIGPRLNAMGRMETAMDSLRLLCTRSPQRAQELAQKLGSTNKTRQLVTSQVTMHAINYFEGIDVSKKSLLFIAHESYEQGVIGLIAGKLVEQYYLPSIVLSKGETHSKASARSISGINIIDTLRTASHLLLDHGGHPMAAGFTVETKNLELLEAHLEKEIQKSLTEDLKTKSIRIDCEIPIDVISDEFYQQVKSFEPCGMGNPQPTFLSKKVIVENCRTIGKENSHLKLKLKLGEKAIEAVAFGMGEKAKDIKVNEPIDIVYTVEENEWNGRKSLQLKIKDVKL